MSDYFTETENEDEHLRWKKIAEDLYGALWSNDPEAPTVIEAIESYEQALRNGYR